MDFDVIFQEINLNTALTFPLQNLVAKTPLPESFEIPLPESFQCLFDPQRSFGKPLRTFRQSFASPVLEKSRFFLLRPNFRPYTRRPLGCLLGFWPSGPKPCGGNYVNVLSITAVSNSIQLSAAEMRLWIHTSHLCRT